MIDSLFEGIKNANTWVTISPIDYGFSSDKKYYVEDKDKRSFLLRLASISLYEAKKKEFAMIKFFNSLPHVMSRVIDFGICNHGQNCYMLLTWIHGEPLEKVISTLDASLQYTLGLKAGAILKDFHSLPVEESDLPSINKIPKKLRQLDAYEQSHVRIAFDQPMIDFIRANINKMCMVPPVYEHGDFHVGNMVFTENHDVGIIDFNRWEVGDPYEEFYKIESFGVEVSIPFCKGEIDGYFGGNPPQQFWEALRVYVAFASLYSIKWAEAFGLEEVRGMVKRYYRAFDDYDGYQLLIPKWYK